MSDSSGSDIDITDDSIFDVTDSSGGGDDDDDAVHEATAAANVFEVLGAGGVSTSNEGGEGALPEGWAMHFDDNQGHRYWYHEGSGVSSWERPVPDSGGGADGGGMSDALSASPAFDDSDPAFIDDDEGGVARNDATEGVVVSNPLAARRGAEGVSVRARSADSVGATASTSEGKRGSKRLARTSSLSVMRDVNSGRRYSIDSLSGVSSWVAEEDVQTCRETGGEYIVDKASGQSLWLDAGGEVGSTGSRQTGMHGESEEGGGLAAPEDIGLGLEVFNAIDVDKSGTIDYAGVCVCVCVCVCPIQCEL